MRERLIYYHYKSQGNRQAFYAEILQDQEILYALYYKCQKNVCIKPVVSQ